MSSLSSETPDEKPPSPPPSSLFPAPEGQASGYAESLRRVREQRKLRQIAEEQQLRTRGDIESRLAKAKAPAASSSSKKSAVNPDRHRYFVFKRRFMTTRVRYDRWDKTFQVHEVPALHKSKAYRRLPFLVRWFLGLFWPLYAPVLLFKRVHLQWCLYVRTLKRVRLPSMGIIAWDAMRLYILLAVIVVVDIIYGQFLDIFISGLRAHASGGLKGWLSHVRQQWYAFWRALGDMNMEGDLMRRLSAVPIQRTSDLLLDSVKGQIPGLPASA